MELSVKVDLCQYLMNVAKLKSDIIAIREGRTSPEEDETILDELFKLKIDGMLIEEKIILEHLDDLCHAVNDNNMRDVKKVMDNLGF